MRRRRARTRSIPDLGTWCATRRDTGDFIGWFALKYVPAHAPKSRSAIGCCHDAWGQGFATEGATRARCATASTISGLNRIIGVTHPDNRASQRVLQKTGLADLGWGRYYDRCACGVFDGDPLTPRDAAMRRAMTVRQALAQVGLAPIDAQVLLAHVLARDRGVARRARDRSRCRVANADAFFALARAAPRRRAGRLPDRACASSGDSTLGGRRRPC